MTVGRFWFDIKGCSTIHPGIVIVIGNKKGKIWAKPSLRHEALQQSEADLASAQAAAAGAPQVVAESPAPSCGPPGAGLRTTLGDRTFMSRLILGFCPFFVAGVTVLLQVSSLPGV